MESREPEVIKIACEQTFFSEAEPERWTPSLPIGYIVPGVPSIYQVDTVRLRFHKAEQRCCCLHFRSQLIVMRVRACEIVRHLYHFTKHIDIFHNKRDLRIFCFLQTLAFPLMSIKRGNRRSKFFYFVIAIRNASIWSLVHEPTGNNIWSS